MKRQEVRMKHVIRAYFLTIGLLLLHLSVRAQPAEDPQTFCNPLNLNYRFMVDAIDAREAADAVIVLYKDDYYLFASRSGGYWTSPDLRNWTLIVPTGLDVETYAPAVMVMRDTLFYVPSANSRTYITTDPKSGIWQGGPTIKSYGDPALFFDDDQRLYMYYGVSDNAPIRGVELDPYTLKELGTPVDFITAQASIHGWERRGDDNLLDEQPWIEGSWMVKENNKYYLHYAGPGTEFKTYSDGIYVADSPLGPYEYATYSPFAFKPTGFISGAGHGSTFKDKDGQYWHIGTMTISVKHMFERRLGIFPVGFDEDGQIRCNTSWGDYPHYFQGVKENPVDNNFAGMLLLSYHKYALASSSLEDHGVNLSVDEDARTYWSAQTGGTDEWLIIDLGKECSVEAIQVNFAEHGTNPELVRGRNMLVYEQYVIENSKDGMNWEILVDKSQNLQDAPHDYIELEQPVAARYIKLKNVFTPGEGNFAVRDLRVFGNTAQAVFTPINDFTVQRDPADGRDVVIHWVPVENADGTMIHYGIAPDKLYNQYMVYDVDSIAIHSLNHGVEYYFDVSTFDSGTEPYNSEGEFRSSQSGNWNDIHTWERHNGTTWIQPAPNVPALSDGPVTILDGHTVTVTMNDSADQLSIAPGGTLVIDQGVLFQVKEGIGTDLTVEGMIRNSGTINLDSLASISFDKNGVYAHEQDGGIIPAAIWRPSATCQIDSVKGTAPSNGNQDFYNVLWNCPDQTGDLGMKWDGNTIGGNITIQSTGSGSWQMCEPEIGSEAMVTINGDIIQSGGRFASNATENASTSIEINHFGNIVVSGGDFSVSRGSQGGSGTTLWNLTGNVSLTDCSTQNSNSTGAKFIFTKDEDMQTLALLDVIFGDGGFPVEVDSGTILDMGTNVLEGNGSFHLKSGSTLLTAHVNGLDGSVATTGTKIFDKAANIGFYGSEAQVSGASMPDTVNNLIISNSAGVTLSNTLVIIGTLEMENGMLSAGSNELVYGANASLQYSGSTAQTTTSAEFPSSGGPENLIIDNIRGVTLHDSRTVGRLDLLRKLDLGANTLTADSTAVINSNAYIITTDGGVLQMASLGASEVLFPVGTTGYAPVWIKNSGTAKTIGAGVVIDTDEDSYEGRVKVKWNLTEDPPGNGEYTLQFGWITSMENAEFKADRAGNARIFNMSDSTEAGTGDYTMQLLTSPRTLSRGGITKLGQFIVGSLIDVTGVDEPLESIPKNFILHENYPNPFHLTTTIDVTIREASHIKIVVCDLLDKEIATLINERLDPGVHSVQWNSMDQASGIYIYKLITENSVQARKMMLIK
ncbi:MAG: family 43 glycosylhydrolase [Bacteroidota bacterium]